MDSALKACCIRGARREGRMEGRMEGRTEERMDGERSWVQFNLEDG